MKKSYKTPAVEKVEFQYDQVVAAVSGGSQSCTSQWMNIGDTTCDHFEFVKNFLD